MTAAGKKPAGVRGNVAHDGANAHERPNAQSATNQEEHDALSAAAILCGEQLGTPQSVEALSGETGGNAPQDYVYPKNPAHGFGVATLDSKAEYGNSNPRQQRQQRRGTEQHAVGDNVAEAAEDCQRADGNQYPLNYAQEALAGCIDVACGSIEVWHKLTVRACSQVPGQVHGNQEDDGLHVHGVLQSGCHHFAERLLLGGSSVLFGPVGGFPAADAEGSRR